MTYDVGLDGEMNIEALFHYFRIMDRSVRNIGSSLLGMTQDTEAKYHVVEEDITKLHIQTEGAHAIIGDDKELDKDYGTLWGAIWEIYRDVNLTTFMILTKLVRTLSRQVGNMLNGLLNLDQSHLIPDQHIWFNIEPDNDLRRTCQ